MTEGEFPLSLTLETARQGLLDSPGSHRPAREHCAPRCSAHPKALWLRALSSRDTPFYVATVVLASDALG